MPLSARIRACLRKFSIILKLVSLFFALLFRKSRWDRTELPLEKGVFSHDPYARLDLECLDGLYMCRVIDLIAALLQCDFYDCVTINNDHTGIDCIELCPGIPLMDVCDSVNLVADNREGKAKTP